jgi:hypothetical protein
MDWAILLGITGIYILLCGLFVHHFMVSKRLFAMNELEIELSRNVMDLTRTNQKIMQIVKNISIENIEDIEYKE